jgi:hypothetical protein
MPSMAESCSHEGFCKVVSVTENTIRHELRIGTHLVNGRLRDMIGQADNTADVSLGLAWKLACHVGGGRGSSHGN